MFQQYTPKSQTLTFLDTELCKQRVRLWLSGIAIISFSTSVFYFQSKQIGAEGLLCLIDFTITKESLVASIHWLYIRTGQSDPTSWRSKQEELVLRSWNPFDFYIEIQINSYYAVIIFVRIATIAQLTFYFFIFCFKIPLQSSLIYF